MKQLIDYLKHVFTHNWIYKTGEGPWEVYECDKCPRTKTIQLHY